MQITVQELDKVDNLVKDKQSFTINGAFNMSTVVAEVEKKLELQGYRVRVLTANRAASLAVGLIPTGITQLAAIGSAVGMVAHNIATYNPDYEIRKHIVDNQIDVVYMH